MNLALLQPYIDEIAEKLPGWWWSTEIKPQGASVHIGAPTDGPYASVRKCGMGSTVWLGSDFDVDKEAPAMFRRAIDSALLEKARCDSAVSTASIHLLSYERRQRREC